MAHTKDNNYLKSLDLRQKFIQSFFSPAFQVSVSQRVLLVPLFLSGIISCITIITVYLFRLVPHILTTPGEGLNLISDAENVIGILLGMIFATEVQNVLIPSKQCLMSLKLMSFRLTEEQCAFLRTVAIKGTVVQNTLEEPMKVPIKLDLNLNDGTVKDFMTTMYSFTGLVHSSEANHLRWVLIDVVMFYHAVLKGYLLASGVITQADIVAYVFIQSYLQFYVVMLMFQVSGSVSKMYSLTTISSRLSIPCDFLSRSLTDWMETNKKSSDSLASNIGHFATWLP